MDVALGAPEYDGRKGAVFVHDPNGLYFTDDDTSDSFVKIFGESSNQRVGAGLATMVDFNGDGNNDMMGMYRNSGDHSLWLLYAGARGNYNVSEVDATIDAAGTYPLMERSMSVGGDIDGDGYGDMVFCDPQVSSNRGQVWIWWGDVTRYEGSFSLANDGTTLLTGGSFSRMGKMCGIGVDVDDDDDAELWVQVPDASGQVSGIYMIPGGEGLRANNQNISDISSRRYVMSSSDEGAVSFGHAGDWDGDGISDIAFGLDQSGVTYGRVWIVGSADEDGIYAGGDLFATVLGDDDAFQEYYGRAISALPGDVNDDGFDDFVAADPYLDSSFGLTPNAGAFYLSLQVE